MTSSGKAGIAADTVKKLYEGRPNILDMITNGKIDLIVNSPVGKDSVRRQLPAKGCHQG